MYIRCQHKCAIIERSAKFPTGAMHGGEWINWMVTFRQQPEYETILAEWQTIPWQSYHNNTEYMCNYFLLKILEARNPDTIINFKSDWHMKYIPSYNVDITANMYEDTPNCIAYKLDRYNYSLIDILPCEKCANNNDTEIDVISEEEGDMGFGLF